MRHNWLTQVNQDSSITFPAVGSYSSITIPLHITEYTVPKREATWQEINTPPQFALGGFNPSQGMVFAGALDPLKTTFSGFIFTPLSSTAATPWAPTTTGLPGGAAIGLNFLSYPEIILAYMEGRMNMTSTGRPRRVEPSSFTDPYGNVYSYHIHILAFEASFTPIRQKQTFNMTLLLEDGLE